MEKLKMHSPNLTQENIRRIMELFPNCVTEVRATTENTESTEKDNSNHSKSSVVKYAIDFDLLRQELSESIVEGPQERYHLNWPGKREALLTANAPIAKTLRPCREESVDFDTTKNLFIEGDNLDALKLLQETYLGKIKMIYIDPPYNTGNDFIYEDDFAENAEEFLKRSNQKDEEGNRLVANTEANGRFHSDWLDMIYPRLKLSRNLLADDGVIVASIDENEIVNLRKIFDEVFGESNLLFQITLLCNPKGRSQDKFVANCHEYLVAYSKQQLNKGDTNIPKDDKEIAKNYKLIDKQGKYRELELRNTHREFGKHNRKNLYYPFFVNTSGEISLEEVPDSVAVYPDWDDGFEGCWTWGQDKARQQIDELVTKEIKGNWKIYRKNYAEGDDGEATKQVKSIWTEKEFHTEKGQAVLNDLFQTKNKIFQSPKSVDIIRQLLLMGSTKTSIVLDFFAGSATTAHAVMQLNAEDGGNRKFIMVQLPESCDEKSEAFKAGYKTIAEISKERIRRAGKKILEKLTTEKHGKSKNEFSGETDSSMSSVPSVVKNPDIGFLEGLTTESTEKQGKGEDDSFSSSSVNSVPSVVKNLDIGFRVLKVDSSNMADVYYMPDAIEQNQLEVFIDNIKPDRTPEDLLFQVLLDWGVDLTLPIRKESVTTESMEEHGKDKDNLFDSSSVNSVSSVVKKSFEVFFVDDNALIACFDDGITEELVKELAQFKPLRVVFCDTRYQSDNDKINVTQIFKQLSPGTEVKAI
ncbi:adenine-specific DNA-methyltransferase [Nitrosomonas aestuarii]|uniref:site-specific DNA-methyltransferase (adenine-specific) n=1 Tax=Nitrosomonas aestuarii TaxID=52441 RepID=A0A1I4FBT4_9PROT|nr:site-specific DNA-methyltransferase [Nitrosomonas aestuarii]SFL14933.1 adenine-specific DNA-methyltransferase [Nitrosomonas aestuarii]